MSMVPKPAQQGVSYVQDPKEIPKLGFRRTPVRRLDDGTVDLVMLVQTTRDGKDTILSVPDALGIHGDTQIGLRRANRILPPKLVESSSSVYRCGFCGEEPNPAPEPGDPLAMSVNNPQPFAPLLHKVVITAEHIESLAAFDQGSSASRPVAPEHDRRRLNNTVPNHPGSANECREARGCGTGERRYRRAWGGPHSGRGR